jgi:hypothetical protein
MVLSWSMHGTEGADVGMLGVPDLVGSLSEGFREWIEQAVCIALVTHGLALGLAVDPYHLMVASHGHDPRHDLFLLGVAFASTLLSYAVGIKASFDHFTHICASRKRNARIFLKLGTDTVLDKVSSCSAPPARQASCPSSASPRYLLSTSNVLIKSHAFSHITQYKEEDDDFLDMLHREHGSGI